MIARQTDLPRRWLILDSTSDPRCLRKLPRGTGLLLLRGEDPARDHQLRRKAKRLGLVLIEEDRGTAVRVHDMTELRSALLARTRLILLSPICETSSHPQWTPIPRLRAAAMARLAKRRLIALGGMDDARFRLVEPLGFQAWAGISAFRT